MKKCLQNSKPCSDNQPFQMRKSSQIYTKTSELNKKKINI